MTRWKAKVYRFFVPLRKNEWLLNGKPCKFTVKAFYRHIEKTKEMLISTMGIPKQDHGKSY